MFKAKFKVQSVTNFENEYVEVKMIASGDSDFTKYTPSGNISFVCHNPEVNKQLVPGKTFLLTFEEE